MKKKKVNKKRTQKKRNKKRVPKPRITSGLTNLKKTSSHHNEMEEAPSGFKIVPNAIAIIEFGKPIMEKGEEVCDDINVGLQMTMACWNYSITRYDNPQTSKTKIINLLVDSFKFNKREADEFLEKMYERMLYLVPPEIQPEYKMNVYMRIEKRIVLEKFDYKKFSFSDTIIPPNETDKNIVNDIRKLDSFIINRMDYDKWEDFYLRIEEETISQYQNWLINKGIDEVEYLDDFIFYVSIFFDYIYRYGMKTVLYKVSTKVFINFFANHVLRKATEEEPEELSKCPAAIKYFFIFLKEKEYLNTTRYDDIIKRLDKQELLFINRQNAIK